MRNEEQVRGTRYEVRGEGEQVRGEGLVRDTKLEVRSGGEEVNGMRGEVRERYEDGDTRYDVKDAKGDVGKKRGILYDKREGKMNEEVASRLKDEMRGDMRGAIRVKMRGAMEGEKQGDLHGGIKGNEQLEKREELQGVDGKDCGSKGQMGMEDLVRKLEELRAEVAVVKGYIVALQMPLMDRCNTWIDGSMVMKVLKINAKALKELREHGMMPYSKTGGRYYYRVEDMDVLLRKNYSKGIKPGGADE